MIRNIKTVLYQTRITADIVILVFSFFVTYLILSNFDFLDMKSYLSADILNFNLSGFVWCLVSRNTGLYSETRTRKLIYEIILTIKNDFYLISFLR